MANASQPAVVSIDALSKSYGEFSALDRLTLEIRAGEVFGLLGPNGSGKSTAIRMLLGFLRPTSGQAWIVGHHCWRESFAARQQIAYLPGELRLYESMNGRQLIEFLARLRGQKIDDSLNRLARRFDIDLRLPLVQLSSGMKRKVALLAVLMPRVPVVILDEPTNTLDPVMRDELLEQISHARNEGKTVLFSSHVLAEVEHVCDRVAILHKGKLVHLQTVSDMNSELRLVQVRFWRTRDAWPHLSGLEIQSDSPTEARLTQRGPLGPLLEWLGQQPVSDLRIEPMGLTDIYGRFHGVES